MQHAERSSAQMQHAERSSARPKVDLARRPKVGGPMSWEAVTAIATAFTGLVIFFTVVLGARQVRAAAEQTKAMSAQLDQLRRATQLEGAMAIFEEMATSQFRDAFRFVVNDLSECLKDDNFRRDALMPGIDPAMHKERYIMSFFERLGTYVKHGLLDEAIFYDFGARTIGNAWSATSALADLMRQKTNDPSLWENFERLSDGAKRFQLRMTTERS